MHRVLLIESSPTKRRALQSALADPRFQLVPSTGFEDALRLLAPVPGKRAEFDGVIAGWPEYSDPRADEFFTLMDSTALSSTPCLLMADSTEPSAVNWLMQRPSTALLLWSDYSECVEALDKLMATSRDRLIQPTDDYSDRHVRVLFVDDSPTVRVAFRRMLTKQGYVVETASNVAEGRERAHQSSFDIAIIDYFMPDGSGDQLVRELKSDPRTASMQIAMITGTYSDRVISDSLDAGASECVFKNEAKELFMARIASLSRTVLDRRSIDNERKRLEGILRSVGDGVYGVDRKGRVTFINPAARDMLGIASDQRVEGQLARDLFHYAFEDGTPMPAASCYMSQCYQQGSQVAGWQTVFWHEVGRPLPVECTVYPLEIDGRREGSVVAFRDVSARKLLEEELRWQATHDSLTKLLNRAFFETQLEQEVHRLRRSDQTSALLFIDVDRFKYINDTAGHAAGDQLLIEVSHRLRARLRASDTLARIGGDEYAIVLRNISTNLVATTADEFRRVMVSKPFMYGGKAYRVSCTIGAAILDNRTQTVSEAMANADIACHLAKNRGRNQIHVFSAETDQRAAMDVELGWSARLEQALGDDAFVLCFQPILPASQIDFDALPEQDGVIWARRGGREPGQLATYEVLIRMRDSDGDLIRPDAFLPTAERFNMTLDIDKWVIKHALRLLSEQIGIGQGIRLSINLSSQSIAAPGLGDYIREKLEEFGVPGDHLQFELSEARALDQLGAAQSLIEGLRPLGCGFALDDFGIGLGSFSHLKHLQLDYLKIDGELVRGVIHDSTDRAVLTAINDIAHRLGRKTVAEHVESRALMEVLRDCGTDCFQGHYIAHPQPSLRAMTGPAALADGGRFRAAG